MKKLVRSRTNRMFAGVIGGIAEATQMDARLLRIIAVVLIFATAFFPLAAIYVLLIFILPNEQDYR
jgi:phage shock protein C